MNEELSDIITHIKMQNLKLDPIKMYEAFYNQHKNIYGSFKHLTYNYNQKMKDRYNWINNKIWDVIESKIWYEKTFKMFEKEYSKGKHFEQSREYQNIEKIMKV